MTNVLLLLARVLLSVMFILSGVQKFGGLDGTAAYVASAGLPAPTVLAGLAAVFETAAGLAILVGFQTRLAALLVAGFCVVTALVFHYAPADPMQMISFMKNLTIAGGMFAIAAAGAGAYSLDARRGEAAFA